ncbi:transglutaminase TgpA family protein [Algisphaera agarilytica]|uniref:Transglutaminase-like putative cysteine protease n=1 Tax=Algisphaera agarilytica TaxID=1385975 RepID=A0A7X0LLZ2_9BACT|nr:transglutaminaseTgpA domain-containing protein [Algisphaera agarilytica]MBB6430473.1 transglutaminase-like putative cysteine protease [Algisphaera agarilytica]
MNTALLFRRLVFAQVLLGIVASCMAERNPGLLLITGAIGAMSWYITEGPRGKTIPRWLVNAGALVAVGWLVVELMTQRSYVVAAMGHFTMALQLLMLYAHKNDREYSQLLVLSLLQMIGASVLSVSMIYGIFLAIYCTLALATVLMFHLTSTADRVHQANLAAAPDGQAPPRPNTWAGPGARRQLRYFGLVIGLVCGLVASAVFVTMPRTGKSPIDIGSSQSLNAPKQTGFSNTVRLGGGPIGTGSREPMLNLKLKTHGQSIGWEDDPWLVRGAALDAYNTETHTWYRSQFAIASDRITKITTLNKQVEQIAKELNQTGVYTAEIALRDSRQRTIFSVVPVPIRRGSQGFFLTHFDSDSLIDVAFSAIDHQLRATESIVGAATYRLSWPSPMRLPALDGESTAPLEPGVPPSIDDLSEDLLPRPLDQMIDHRSYSLYGGEDASNPSTPEINKDNYSRLWEVETEKVRNMALRIIREAGLDRDPEARHTPDDLNITMVLAEYLRARYAYDLANPPARKGEDPLISFLFETRRGHCELFASGLAALCRSIGIPARVITGFRASEFNALGGYYVVRQSNAHAWTEVDGGPGIGWRTFDATPPDRVEAEHSAPEGFFASVREFYEHIEFAWIRSVVAFDRQTQEDVIHQVTDTVRTTSRDGLAGFKQFIQRMKNLPGEMQLGYLELFAAGLCIVGLLIASGIMLRLFLSRRRRILRLQLTTLPAPQRRGLSRRLRFYLIMLDILERHGFHRPDWQSPASFAQELAEANPMRFDPVVALTDLFYEIRFGHRPLDADRKRRIRAHLKHLEHSIADNSV